MLSAEAALERLCDPITKVSCHYLITKEGLKYQLVKDEHRAWHAGKSSWEGRPDLNSWSIGVELDYPGYFYGYWPDFAITQIHSLLGLLDNLYQKHSIPKKRILGHSDIAPDRKIDPGPRFPWDLLQTYGFGKNLGEKTHS